MKVFLTILTAGILTDNVVMVRLFGLPEALGGTNSLRSSCVNGGAMTVFLFVSALFSYPVYRWILTPLGAEYLGTLLFVMINCGAVTGLLALAERFAQPICGYLSLDRKALTASSTLLGVCLLYFENDLIVSYPQALLYAVAGGVGFTLASVIFTGLRDRLRTASAPEAVQGLPLTLLAASLAAMAFAGFAGI